MIHEILLLALTIEVLIFIIWKYEGMKSAGKITQHETDLRLTYKRYMELYPGSTISYPEYKKLQARKAYKKAVSSNKIKRMVR